MPDSLVPVSQLGPLVMAHMGELKAQLRSDLEKDIAKLPTKYDLYGAIVAGLVAAFTIFALMGDRIEHAIDRSSSLTEKLTKVETQGADNAKVLEKLSRDKSEPETSPSAKPAK